jgi:IS30 family transposase
MGGFKSEVQHFPSWDFSICGKTSLKAMAEDINGRPRKGLGVRSLLAVCPELLVNKPQHSTLVH